MSQKGTNAPLTGLPSEFRDSGGLENLDCCVKNSNINSAVLVFQVLKMTARERQDVVPMQNHNHIDPKKYQTRVPRGHITRMVWHSRVQCPTRHSIGHFGDGGPEQ